MIKKIKQKKNKSGFSIMELMFAVFVLTIGIIGTLQLISSTIRNSIDTRNSAIASGLVQEGVELVRNVRDNTMLTSLSDLYQDSLSQFAVSLPNNSNCAIGFDTSLSCVASPVQVLYLNSNAYSHTISSNPTIFSRKISIVHRPLEMVNGTLVLTGADVTSNVWWSGSAGVPSPCNLANKCISVTDYLPKRD